MSFGNPCLCADCGISTLLREWYMVKDSTWEQAWAGRLSKEYLCICCLEARIGRTLMRCDFIDAPINDLNVPHTRVSVSKRLRACLEAE